MRNTFIRILLEKAKQDERIILLSGDMGYGVVDQFSVELPDQFINFGINEQTMMSAAAGLASQGFKPFVYSIGNFPTFRCLEQIRNDVCYMNLNVTIVALGAGFAYGTAGYSHHLVEDISAISPLPNIRIFSPADTYETEKVAEKVLSLSGPKYVRLGKGGEGEICTILNQDFAGMSVYPGLRHQLVLSTGNILTESLATRDMLSNESPTIASCYDFGELQTYLQNNEFSKIITIEEHVSRGGFGSMVREFPEVAQSDITSIGIQRIRPEISGSQKFLRSQYKITRNQIMSNLS
jgi:transketolase